MKTFKPCFLDFKFLYQAFRAKIYSIFEHVKKILSNFLAKYRPNVTTIQEAKYLNMLSLESMIRNLHSHEMGLNGDELVMKYKTLALELVTEKSGGKVVRP